MSWSSASAPVPPGRTAARYLAVALLAALPALAALQRPLHIDDYGHYQMAARARAHPTDPLGGSAVFCGRRAQLASYTHPLLYVYMQAGALASGLPPVLALHLLAALIAGGAGVGLYSLSRRFTRSPLAASLLVLTTPVWVVNAAGCMLDVPTLAFWLLGMAAFEWRERSDWLAGTLAGLLAGAACLISYSAGFMLVLICLRAVLDRRLARRALVTVSGAVVPLGLWLAAIFARYRVIHPLTAIGVAEHQQHYSATDVLGFLATWGGTLALPVVGLLAAWKLPELVRRAFPVVALAVIAVWVAALPLGALGTVLLVVFVAGAGLWIVLGGVELAAAIRRPGRLQGETAIDLSLAFWFLALPPLLFYLQPNFAARYLLPVAPPAIWLAARHFERRSGRPAASRLALAALAGLPLSVLLWRADYVMARGYPAIMDWATRAIPPGAPRFFSGEFGLRFGAEPAGFVYADDSMSSLPIGSRLLHASYAGEGLSVAMHPNAFAALTAVDEFRVEDPVPLRLYNGQARAGFYSIRAGPLPWTLSTAPVEVARIYRTERATLWQEPGIEAAVAPPETPWGPFAVLSSASRQGIGPDRAAVEVSAVLQRGAAPLATLVLTAETPWQARSLEPDLDTPRAADWLASRGDLARLVYQFYPWFDVVPGKAELTLAAGDAPSGEAVPLGSVTLDPRVSLVPPEAPIAQQLTWLAQAPAWRTLLAPGTRATLLVSGPRPAEWLALVSYLGNSIETPQGETIGRLALADVAGNKLELEVRAGLETAEWALEREGSWVAHRMPPVAGSWTVESQSEGAPPFSAHSYLAVYPLEGLGPVRQIELENDTAGAIWTIEALTLRPAPPPEPNEAL